MHIKVAAATGLIAALGATALLASSAAATSVPGHRPFTHTHARRWYRARPSRTVRRYGGGVIQHPVWGHQGNLLTLRPRSSLTFRSRGLLRPHSVLPANGGGAYEDPIRSECWDANAYVASSAPILVEGSQVGYVANWYSPDCGTNWAEAVLTDDPGFGEALGSGELLDAFILDETTGEYYMFPISSSNGTYTDMTHSATTVACASGDLLVNDGRSKYATVPACA
jgi:hypothetical protein